MIIAGANLPLAEIIIVLQAVLIIWLVVLLKRQKSS